MDAGLGELASGYTLYSQLNRNTSAVVVDMEGEVVHEWGINGFPVQMLPGGALMGAEGQFENTQGCQALLREEWSGEQSWYFDRWSNDDGTWYARQHHGMVVEGNPVGYYAPGQEPRIDGDVLVLAHADKDVAAINPTPLRDDVIYEVNLQGELGDFVWYATDHVDELGFSAAARATLLAFEPARPTFEWLHGNSIVRVGPNRHYEGGDARFHPENIIYSSRRANLVVIIDHLDGDVVWRIGPEFSGQPEEGLGQFVGQHFPHIIPVGLPGEGNMLVFDNGGNSGYPAASDDVEDFTFSRDFSRVVEFDPAELELVWQYGSGDGEDRFLSELTSSAQRLPNGNTLIAAGDTGEIIEVTAEKRVVWRYVVPSETEKNAIYRAYRLPPEWLPEGAHTRDYPDWSE